MKKIFFIILFMAGLGAGVLFGPGKNLEKIDLPKQEVLSIKDEKKAEEIVQEIPDVPKTIAIPKIQVQATVEPVGMDSQGRMDVPKNADNVAWYNLGGKPGNTGSAVMAGHFDKESGAPAVFYKIDSLSIGDTIVITDAKGQEYTFAVTRIEEYPYDNFPLQEVFGASEKPMLNLITCEGKWNKETKNYSHRTVVYSELIE